ncbi:MAG: hypothetical protein H0V09_11235 [Gemmatimonadetes bacterium]|nr:hypothetical protein [Gemmatimonadota bacterium]
MRKLSTGVTKPSRATLDDGALRHDAAIQSVNHCEEVGTRGGRRERECDSYRYNLAAYELGKLFGLRFIPPCVEREFGGRDAAFTWWIDGAMTFAEMKAQGLSPPDGVAWNHQQFVVGIFDELIYNTDRHSANLLVDPQWRVWMIDHTRAFRVLKRLRNPGMLARLRMPPAMMSALESLTSETLDVCCRRYLSSEEIKGVLARRDSIVGLFSSATTAASPAP